MAIFDTSQEHPPDKVRRYIITTIVFIALVVGFAWYLLRFHTEVRTAKHFLDTVDERESGTGLSLVESRAELFVSGFSG